MTLLHPTELPWPLWLRRSYMQKGHFRGVQGQRKKWLRRFVSAFRIFIFLFSGAHVADAAPQSALPRDNPGVVEVSSIALTSFKRVIALSDVHGMYQHVTQLLQGARVLDQGNHWRGGKTLLVITGDSIDKGPQSLEVLALWMRLQEDAPKQGGRVIVLLGNHEAELLANPIGDTKTKMLEEELSRQRLHITDLAEGKSGIPILGLPLRRYAAFLRSLPIAARLGDWLFCHAGWVPPPTSLLTPVARWQALVEHEQTALRSGDYSALLRADGMELLERKEYPTGTKWWRTPEAFRTLEKRLHSYGLQGAIFGHCPLAFEIEDGIGYPSSKDHQLIKIDSGMAPEAGGFSGHLLLFPHPQELAGTRATHALSISFEHGQTITTPLREGLSQS